MHGRPRIVLITGEPGSGKTTLGDELARALRIPFLARDDVRGGLFFTAGSWTEAPVDVPSAESAVEAFLALVETFAGRGVSCVVEYVVRTDRADDLERLTRAADCVVVRTECSDPVERLVERNRTDRLLGRGPVLDALGFDSIDEHTADMLRRMEQVRAEMRTRFEMPTLEVRTDDGFDPALDEIVRFATASTSPHDWT